MFLKTESKVLLNIVNILVRLSQVTLNNLEVSSNNIQKLKKDLEVMNQVFSSLYWFLLLLSFLWSILLLLATFRFDYEYKIEYKYDFSNLVGVA